MRAAIYARISLDKEGEGSGVERQLADCREYLAARGWEAVGEYVDNDISAFSGRKRPAFERLLQADADVVVVWKSDRLARRGHDLQRFLDTGMQLASVTEPEFTGATGLLMLRILAGFAEHESGVKSERVARKMKQKAENGDPHAGGKRCFGYTADGRHLEPAEAAELRDAARRILAGETVSAIVHDWHKRQVGTRWTGSNLTRLLRSPRLAGLREVEGTIVQGTFPAIVDRPTWERLCAVLAPRRKNTQARTYLLTGLLRCGLCGSAMVGGGGSYRCSSPLRGGCGRISIRAAATDDHVTRMALAAVPASDTEPSTQDEVELLLDALRELEAGIAQLAKDHYVEKRISRPAYLAANDDLEHRAATLREQIADHKTGEDFGSLDDIVQAWEHQSVSWRQSVLRTVLERVVVDPATGTRQAASGRLRLFWRA